MDDDLQQFEAELKQLRPAAPSRELAARIAHALEQPADIQPAPVSAEDRVVVGGFAQPLRWLVSFALPAAAVVTLSLLPFARERGSITEPRRAPAARMTAAPLKPITAENVLVSASDEGLVTLDDGTPARRERLQYVDTITWQNPRTRASLTWSVPREEVRVVPVSFQ